MPEKLVRDRIPQIMSEAGVPATVRVAPASERLKWLLRKLKEEVGELAAEPCIEECADVWEVLLAIASELGVSEHQLFALAEAKAKERGHFAEGYLLTVARSSSK